MNALPSSVLTQFRNQPAPAGKWSAKWLALAYGDTEANTAMLLPQSLREELYGDVLWFGPAHERINAFVCGLKVCIEASKQELNDALWRFDDQITSPGRGITSRSVANEVLLWVEQNDYAGLKIPFLSFTEVDPSFRSWSREIAFMCWYLTGELVFTDRMVGITYPFVEDVNHVLDLAKCAPLGGCFASASL